MCLLLRRRVLDVLVHLLLALCVDARGQLGDTVDGGGGDLKQERQVEMGVGDEAFYLSPNPVLARIIIVCGGIIRVEASQLAVLADHGLLARWEPLVDCVPPQMFEEVEIDEV